MESRYCGIKPGNRSLGMTQVGTPRSTLAGIRPRKMLFGTSVRISVYGGSPNACTACFAYEDAASADVVKYLPSSPATLRRAPVA